MCPGWFVCCWSGVWQRGAAGTQGEVVTAGWNPGDTEMCIVHSTGTGAHHCSSRREQCLEWGLVQKPLSPVSPGSAGPGDRPGSPLHTLPGWRGIHPRASRVPIYRLQLASSHGDFLVLPSSLTMRNPAFSPPHFPVFISLSTSEDLIYNKEFFRLAASFYYLFQ